MMRSPYDFLLLLCVLSSVTGCTSTHRGTYSLESHDYPSAFTLLSEAAENGDADARYALGVMYMDGQGVEQDYRRAFKWYSKAAEQGHVSAQFNLGLLYGYGRGVVYDHVAAFNWLYKAARQGHVAAKYYIGSMYYHRGGNPAEYKAAFKWFSAAAEQGVVEAYYYLGDMCFSGQGTAKNNTESYVWFKLATDHDAKYRGNLEWVTHDLSDAELRVADDLYGERKREIEQNQRAANKRDGAHYSLGWPDLKRPQGE